MKVKCKKTLYWHQRPGYHGYLCASPKMDGIDGFMAFEEGNEYDFIVIPSETGTGLNHIKILTISADGKAYTILGDELHSRSTEKARRHFDFSFKIDTIDGFPAGRYLNS